MKAGDTLKAAQHGAQPTQWATNTYNHNVSQLNCVMQKREFIMEHTRSNTPDYSSRIRCEEGNREETAHVLIVQDTGRGGWGRVEF